VLHVGVHDALRTLAADGRIYREKACGRFVHLSADSAAPTPERRPVPYGRHDPIPRPASVRLRPLGPEISFGDGDLGQNKRRIEAHWKALAETLVQLELHAHPGEERAGQHGPYNRESHHPPAASWNRSCIPMS